MRCPVPLLAAWCWVALPHALLAQPAPNLPGASEGALRPQPRSPSAEAHTPTESVPPQAGETNLRSRDQGRASTAQLPVAEPGAPSAPGVLEGSDDTTTVVPGDEVLEPAASAESAGASADTMTAEQNELRARIEALGRGQPLDESVQRPLDFAKAALERSRASRAVGETASETRTQKLARAAVELAEARLRLLRERSLYLAARGRHDGASAELAVAQRALERERARARELQRASQVP